MAMQQGEISIGKLAKELEISTATINFYVSRGVLPPPRKLNRTRAAYSDRHRRILRLIKTMQTQGYTLTTIKRLFEFHGTDDTALSKLEGIGSFQPLPPVRNAAERRPLEHFEPVGREAFLERTGATAELVDHLETIGLLRPLAPGRYNVSDARLVLSLQSLLDDGIPLEHLDHLSELVPVLMKTSVLVAQLTQRYRARLRTRETRYRDLTEPFTWTSAYLFDRVHREQHPAWELTLYDEEEE